MICGTCAYHADQGNPGSDHLEYEGFIRLEACTGCDCQHRDPMRTANEQQGQRGSSQSDRAS